VPNLALTCSFTCMVVLFNKIIYCQLLFSFSHIVFATVVLSFKFPCVMQIFENRGVSVSCDCLVVVTRKCNHCEVQKGLLVWAHLVLSLDVTNLKLDHDIECWYIFYSKLDNVWHETRFFFIVNSDHIA